MSKIITSLTCPSMNDIQSWDIIKEMIKIVVKEYYPDWYIKEKNDSITIYRNESSSYYIYRLCIENNRIITKTDNMYKKEFKYLSDIINNQGLMVLEGLKELKYLKNRGINIKDYNIHIENDEVLIEIEE